MMTSFLKVWWKRLTLNTEKYCPDGKPHNKTLVYESDNLSPGELWGYYHREYKCKHCGAVFHSTST